MVVAHFRKMAMRPLLADALVAMMTEMLMEAIAHIIAQSPTVAETMIVMETMTIQVLTTLYSHTGAVMMTATVMTILEKQEVIMLRRYSWFVICLLFGIFTSNAERTKQEVALIVGDSQSLHSQALLKGLESKRFRYKLYSLKKLKSLPFMMRFLINTSIVQLLGLLIKTTPIRSCRLKNHIFGQISSVIVVV